MNDNGLGASAFQPFVDCIRPAEAFCLRPSRTPRSLAFCVHGKDQRNSVVWMRASQSIMLRSPQTPIYSYYKRISPVTTSQLSLSLITVVFFFFLNRKFICDQLVRRWCTTRGSNSYSSKVATCRTVSWSADDMRNVKRKKLHKHTVCAPVDWRNGKLIQRFNG